MSSIEWSDTTDVTVFSVCVGVGLCAAGYLSYRFRHNLFSRWIQSGRVSGQDATDAGKDRESDEPSVQHGRIASMTHTEYSRNDSLSHTHDTTHFHTSVSGRSSRHSRGASVDMDRRYIACSHCHATLALPLSSSSPVVQCIYCKCINNIESVQTETQPEISKSKPQDISSSLPHGSKIRTPHSTTSSLNARPKFKYDMDEPSPAEAAAAAAAASYSSSSTRPPSSPSQSASHLSSRPAASRRYEIEPSISSAVGRVQFADHDDYEPSFLSRPRPRQSSSSSASASSPTRTTRHVPVPVNQQQHQKEVPTVGDLVADELEDELQQDDEERENSMVINTDDGRADQEYFYEDSRRHHDDHLPPTHEIELDIQTLESQQHHANDEYLQDIEAKTIAQEEVSRSQVESDEALEGEIGAMISDLRMGQPVEDDQDPISAANMHELP